MAEQPSLEPLLADLGQCASSLQKLIDLLGWRYDEQQNVRAAAGALHHSLGQVSLRVLDRQLREAGYAPGRRQD